MSLNDALLLAALVDAARNDFTEKGELALERFHEQAGVILAGGGTVAQVRERLNSPATLLMLALAASWAASVNTLLIGVHKHLNLGPPPPYSNVEARDLMTPGVLALVNAALMTTRTALNPAQAWGRQYERGGAFTALRGSIRGASAGTLNTLANASVIDTLRARDGPSPLVLGAYNPLDERTNALDRALVLNTGEAITTARGRVVRSIPGQVGKYTFSNAWVPGSPRTGGDTHDGCRCWLIPERLVV